MSTLNVEGIKNSAATSNAITFATDGTCTARVTNNLSNRNVIINGAMTVFQRGLSTTSPGGFGADRWRFYASGGTTTLSVETLSSGDPYNLGFRKYSRLTNTANATGATNYRLLRYTPEAQDLANSGWNYVSASSYITLSFWIRSSIAQNFYAYIHTKDGTEKAYIIETGSLTANAWTKITKTIPGAAGITINNDNGQGALIDFVPFWGTDYTGTVNLNEWVTYSGATRTPNMTNTWAATNGATFDITGAQLEVGDTATDFEHRSFTDELLRCQRYYLIWADHTLAGGDEPIGCSFYNNGNYKFYCDCRFPVEMRANASVIVSNSSNHFRTYGDGAGANCDTLSYDQLTKRVARVGATTSLDKKVAGLRAQAGGYLHFNAEI